VARCGGQLHFAGMPLQLNPRPCSYSSALFSSVLMTFHPQGFGSGPIECGRSEKKTASFQINNG
jgi:hypothetical protein